MHKYTYHGNNGYRFLRKALNAKSRLTKDKNIDTSLYCSNKLPANTADKTLYCTYLISRRVLSIDFFIDALDLSIPNTAVLIFFTRFGISMDVENILPISITSET